MRTDPILALPVSVLICPLHCNLWSFIVGTPKSCAIVQAWDVTWTTFGNSAISEFSQFPSSYSDWISIHLLVTHKCSNKEEHARAHIIHIFPSLPSMPDLLCLQCFSLGFRAFCLFQKQYFWGALKGWQDVERKGQSDAGAAIKAGTGDYKQEGTWQGSRIQ